MIELSTDALGALQRSYTYHVRAESWLADRLLADDIPIESGTEQGDRSLRVPERVTLTVPRIELGTDWTPVADDSPLAANGQRLKIELGIGLGVDRIEWFQRGWFVIESSEPKGDSVSVTCAGLLYLIDEARLVSPYQPTGTILATLQGLVEPALTVINNGVDDRSVPADVNYDEDRLGAVFELLDAWPADAIVTAQGYLAVDPVNSAGDTAVLTLTNGENGTIIDRPNGTSTREGAWNVVVARGTDANGAQVQGVSYLERGPKIYGGNFNPLPVPYFFSSPLITNTDQAKESARTVMQRLSRQADRMLSVEMVPHPALVLGDVVQIEAEEYTGLASIEQLSLPYTPDAGPQTLVVRCLE